MQGDVCGGFPLYRHLAWNTRGIPFPVYSQTWRAHLDFRLLSMEGFPTRSVNWCETLPLYCFLSRLEFDGHTYLGFRLANLSKLRNMEAPCAGK